MIACFFLLYLLKPTKEISVVLPFHNPGVFFDEAVQSVLDQDHHDFELLLVNNGSDEGSINTAQRFAAENSVIRIIDEPQIGIANALNSGIAHSNGKYIARMDADDICAPGRLRVQATYLNAHPGCGLVSGKVTLIGSMTFNEGMREYVNTINALNSEDEIYNYRFVDAPFAHPAVMFRKELINLYGGYSAEPVPEDFELWIRWFTKGVKMAKVQQEVLLWRDHPNRASRTSNTYQAEAFDRVRLQGIATHMQSVNSDNRPVYIWGGGKLAMKKMQILIDNGLKPEGIIDVKTDRKIAGYDHMHYLNIPAPGNIYIISLVSNRGKYKEIFDFLIQKGYLPERDFLIGA